MVYRLSQIDSNAFVSYREICLMYHICINCDMNVEFLDDLTGLPTSARGADQEAVWNLSINGIDPSGFPSYFCS